MFFGHNLGKLERGDNFVIFLAVDIDFKGIIRIIISISDNTKKKNCSNNQSINN